MGGRLAPIVLGGLALAARRTADAQEQPPLELRAPALVATCTAFEVSGAGMRG
jgi:hypothetical protein